MVGKKAGLVVNWSVTGKRGRKEAAHNPRSPLQGDIGVAEADMASCLVMLACSNGAQNGVESVEMEENNTEESSHVPTTVNVAQKWESDESCRHRGSATSGRTRVSGSVRIRPVDDTEEGESVYWSEDSNGRVYKCDKCEKSFGCHQALGGHRASHRKVKGCFAVARSRIFAERLKRWRSGYGEKEEGTATEVVLQNQSSSESTSVGNLNLMAKKKQKKKRKDGHECCICHKVFQSGQALGGHKRCHWAGNKESGKSSSATAMSQSLQWPGLRDQVMLLPDLNQLPPADDDLDAAYSMN